MAVIGMIGPHAVGKTTAARRWAKRYSGLLVALADNERETTGATWDEVMAGRPNMKDWKEDKETKAARARFHRDRDGVTLIESARGFSTWLAEFGPDDPVIVLTCPEPIGRKLLETRRGGKPLSEYWHPRRLEYECVHYPLSAMKKLRPSQAKHFVIEDQERDWPAVDEYFGSVFRRLHNALVAKRAKG